VSISAGQVQQNNFYDYPVLRMSEMPEIDIQIIATDNPHGGWVSPLCRWSRPASATPSSG
jgi:isoquinoline 1-oxidoreductase beta subunit